MPRIGAIIIGQSPRSDLVKPLQKANSLFQYIESGALDFVQPQDIPHDTTAEYLLTTRLRDGSLVEVSEAFLAPLLQKAIAEVEKQDVNMSVLLCAGPFDMLKSTKPLYRPTAMVTTILEIRGYQRIAVLSPNQTQAMPIHRKWLQRGFQPTVLVDPQLPPVELAAWIREQLIYQHNDCLILDYVGHPLDKVQTLEQLLPLPVIDLGKVITDMLRHQM
jgi:protein AroM